MLSALWSAVCFVFRALSFLDDISTLLRIIMSKILNRPELCPNRNEDSGSTAYEMIVHDSISDDD